MELRHLRYFAVLAEELHFGRAAVRLHMAQPPLSQQIKQLEAEMGVTLFNRTNRRVELTPAGEGFRQEVQEILRRVDAAVLQAQRTERGESGWLGIGFVGSATYEVLPPILRQFRAAYPDVELILQEVLGEEQEKALRAGRIHVGFTRKSLPEPGNVVERFLEEPLVVALPAGHPLVQLDEVPLASLAGEPFILFLEYAPSSYGAHILRVCEEAGFTPKMAQRVGELQIAVGLVSAGIGVTLVPSSIQHQQREGVVFLPLAAPAPTIGLTLTYREEEKSPILGNFLRIARASKG